MLRDVVAPPTPAADSAPGPRGHAALPPAASAADLVALLADEEARMRRRAALAVGRVGLVDGVDPLLPLLATPILKSGRWRHSRLDCSATGAPATPSSRR